MRRKAFTLVELLVVIGIIALLIAILLPVLSGAKRAAETTKCAAHLADMGKAWQLYANAYGVCVPGRMEKLSSGAPQYGLPGDNADEYRPRWYELLGAMVGQYANKAPKAAEDDTWLVTSDWFICPAVPEYINSRNFPYGYNHLFLGDARPKGGPTMAGAKQWINYPVKPSTIRAASETVMICDSLGTAASFAESQRFPYYLDGRKDPKAVLNKGYLIDSPRSTGVSDLADIEQPNAWSGPDPRHKKKINVVFCDGHVDLKTPQEIGYVILSTGATDTKSKDATNRYFSGTGEDIDPPPSK